MSCKTSLLVTFEILGLFFNTLTVDDKYPCYKNEAFRLAIQVQLSKKLKLFYQFFIAFLKSTPNFAHVEKKDQVHSSAMSDIRDSERYSYLNTLKAMF